MKTILFAIIAGTAAAMSCSAADIVTTPAYRWSGDTIYQGEYFATALSPYEIKSTYSARPGYFMLVSEEWKRKNDLSPYPSVSSGNVL